VIAWPALSRQVRMLGGVTRTSDVEDDEYWSTRPRGSHLATLASDQSAVIPDRHVLDRRVAELEAEYAGRDIPRPSDWGGMRLRPDRVEFWQGREYRLHDRLAYVRTPDGWRVERLAP
jgi:pyridoxamine-phosphate oxidase